MYNNIREKQRREEMINWTKEKKKEKKKYEKHLQLLVAVALRNHAFNLW